MEMEMDTSNSARRYILYFHSFTHSFIEDSVASMMDFFHSFKFAIINQWNIERKNSGNQLKWSGKETVMIRFRWTYLCTVSIQSHSLNNQYVNACIPFTFWVSFKRKKVNHWIQGGTFRRILLLYSIYCIGYWAKSRFLTNNTSYPFLIKLIHSICSFIIFYVAIFILYHTPYTINCVCVYALHTCAHCKTQNKIIVE